MTPSLKSTFVLGHRHLLGIEGLSPADITGLLDLSEEYVELNRQVDKKRASLRGRTQVNLFFEASTRTQSSFEIAGKRLGADVMTFSVGTSSVKKGESLRDTVETISAFGIDAIVVRHASSGVPHRIRQWTNAAILNGGDGWHQHPTQALLDSYTIRSHFGSLDGLRIAIVGDVKHSRVARSDVQAFTKLGAEVVPLAVEPNGRNINAACGATLPEVMRQQVVSHGADLGIALDGDADRVVMADEHGMVLDGDQLMGLIAQSWQRQGRLKGGGVVATVMSNLGLERHLKKLGLTLIRTAVGDRYVVERMREGGYNVGGEQSGHIVLGDMATTGDGLVAALQVLAAILELQRPVSEAAHVFEPVPQVLRNVRIKGGKPLEDQSVRTIIKNGETRLGDKGRLLIRPSGTEPLIRVMAEGDDAHLVETIVSDVVAAVEQAAAK